MLDFEKELIDKIDCGDSLSESEIKTFIWEAGEEVSREYGDNRRWSRMVYIVKKVDDRYFHVSYDEGLTEYQDNEYYEQPYEVFKEEHQETITVTNWTKVENNSESEKKEKEKSVNMNDLQIIINETPAVIDTNFEEVKNSLANMMEAYKGLTYTDDTVKDARNDIATLRKIRKAIDDKRKEVKKSHMIPYDEFETKCKELCSIIDNAINPIDKQIEEYSERKRQEKKAAILEYFNSKIGDIDCLTFDEVFNSTWISNMSTTMKSIKIEIDNRIESVKSDLEAILSTESEVKDKAIDTYKKTKRLSDAMKVINDYEQQKREILAREEARKKKEEERRRREEERRRIEEEQRKAREEAARIAEEERKKREEEARIEREKQEAIEKAKAEERARIQREIAEKKKLEQIPKEQPVNPFIQQNVSPEPAQQNPFGQAATVDPFASAQEPVEQVSGEVEPIATSQSEQLHNVMVRFKATDSQIDAIEKFLLSINVSFVKQVM